MVAAAIVLIIIGVVFGFMFPVVFVAAVAGLVLLVISLVATGRRAKDAVEESSEPG
jgi:UPF0716 family protein affecting phage T7 exclusion